MFARHDGGVIKSRHMLYMLSFDVFFVRCKFSACPNGLDEDAKQVDHRNRVTIVASFCIFWLQLRILRDFSPALLES